MNTNRPVGFPHYEQEVHLRVLPEQVVTVNGAETELPNLRADVGRAISGKRTRLNVEVSPPEAASEEFLGFVRRVQEQIRRAEGVVGITYRTV